MQDYLKLKKANCKNCYKCIRHCPVKSIRFSDHQANIVNDECVLCGQCFVACPQNAKEIRNDVASAKALIAGESPVYASIAPSFVANYDGVTIKSMDRALKRLGFAGAEETAVGATIVKRQYDLMANMAEQDVIISSCCSTINLLIQKHYPQALPYLAHVVSPMQAHCKAIKRAPRRRKNRVHRPVHFKKSRGGELRGHSGLRAYPLRSCRPGSMTKE